MRFSLSFTFCFVALLPIFDSHVAAAEKPESGSGATESVQSTRTEKGLLALYTFDELGGNVIHDAIRSAPLDLRAEGANPIIWQTGRLQLTKGSLLRSVNAPVPMYEAMKASGEFSLEIWFRPERTDQTGPARIVSCSTNPSQRNLTIGQQQQRIEVRLRTSETDANGMPSTATPEGSLTTDLTHLVVGRDASGWLRIFLDGREVAQRRVPGNFSSWDHSYPLLFGNEGTGDRPWEGELDLVAIYDRALTASEVTQHFQIGASVTSRLQDMLPPPADRPVDFVADVQPILSSHCFECHATGNEEGSLNLGIRARVLEGGISGPVIQPGDSMHSLMIHLVSGVDSLRVMPPDDDPLSEEQIGVLRAWIDQGAKWPPSADVTDPRLERAREHWAFQRLGDAQPPQLADDDWSRTAIDRFILARLREHQLTPAFPLGLRALVRRLTFDLTGLPPTQSQFDAVPLNDEGGDDVGDVSHSVQELIDTLLQSRHYGERWARHWLDAARFAESDGQESDADRPFAYRYRDFVIRAFNDDMPYDQFVRWQIAGDEFAPDNPEAVIATGFLTAGTHSELGEEFLEEEKLFNRYNELDDVVSTMGSAMLGLTLACARCHDHKYDALSAREYYRLLSAFHSGDRHQGTLPDGSEALFFRDFDSQVRPTWLFRRADFYDRELEVRLGFPEILTLGGDAEEYWLQAREQTSGASSTLQRRALAQWLTDVDQGAGPLLARVMVNRIWQHHFGYGLVRTEGDFGVRGEPPTHPELLEYLASEFIRNGWSIKHLHRMILSSAVWQQGHGTVEASDELVPHNLDPDNRLLSRMLPRRLEAEVLRDSMLAVSGTLNLEPYGPSFKPPIPPEANLARNLKGEKYPTDAKDDATTRRRSVYMFHKRLLPYPLVQAFDRPDLLVSCTRRQNTTVAPQALALMNDPFVRASAESFAERLVREASDDLPILVERSFQLALARGPLASEQETAVRFIQTRTEARKERGEPDAQHQALTDYCHTLFCTNEFLYVD